MPSLVLLTDDAAHDLEEIHDYIARHDSIRRARHVLERICASPPWPLSARTNSPSVPSSHFFV